MPVNKTLMKKLIAEYGYDKAKEIYYKMESEGKPSFKKGLDTAIKEKHTQKHFTKKGKK
jgi:hypothetical protein